ncbi:anti-sigma factor family protein [Kitasatospora camelliae]|uniref:Zf-HC2 domain-containing protein n=1 Tax=Kitasatospora camelliae TaxID=3156397 RepID=A0AAU8K1W2_9ACTN
MTERSPESQGRSRWAQLSRRAEQQRGEQQGESAELRALPVRPAEPAPDEHLGDRLTAYLDGELGHDSRERVQAHLATCADCLAEADAGRAVKHLLTEAVTPAPSSMLMARLLAVAAAPEDERGDGPGGGSVAATGTLGGSRLTGGSFGRGAGSTFGGGALGADSPIPGIDPRARQTPPRPFASRRGGPLEAPRPLAALAGTAMLRPAPARGRRLVFAAAGAFSVAAVTLGGVGFTTGAAGSVGENRHRSVTPAGVPGGDAIVPVTAQLPYDQSDRSMSNNQPPAAVPQPFRFQQESAADGYPRHLPR